MLRTFVLILLLTAPAHAQTLGPSISGDARMGIVWQSKPAWAGQRESGLRMTSRARLTFQFLGETDGGLRFGAEVRLDPEKERARLRQVTIGQ